MKKVKKTYSEKLYANLLNEITFFENDFRYKTYEAFILPSLGYKSFHTNNAILNKIAEDCRSENLGRIEAALEELIERLDFLEKENKKLVNVIIQQRRIFNEKSEIFCIR